MEFTHESTVIIDAPIPVVYSDWVNADTLPHVLTHVRATAQSDAEDLARLVIMLDGHHIEFAAQRTMCCESSICWQSMGDDFYYVLSVTFDALDGGRTRVTAHVTYDPPGFLPDIFETLGLARVFRRGLDEDMRRYAGCFRRQPELQTLATAV